MKYILLILFFLLVSIILLYCYTLYCYFEKVAEVEYLLINGRCSIYEGKSLLKNEKILMDINIENEKLNGINGIYWKDTDFYCVWAKYRTLEEQEKTDRHEYCHYLVDNDYEHFCKK